MIPYRNDTLGYFHCQNLWDVDILLLEHVGLYHVLDPAVLDLVILTEWVETHVILVKASIQSPNSAFPNLDFVLFLCVD